MSVVWEILAVAKVAYRKVFSGESTVSECCEAMKRVQDCYAVCPCDTDCAEQDRTFCPSTGTVKDPIRWVDPEFKS